MDSAATSTDVSYREAVLIRRVQLLTEAVRAACVLIWEDDAVVIKGGAEALDAWVDRYGPLIGYDTGNDRG